MKRTGTTWVIAATAAVTLAGCAIFKHTDPLQVTLAGIEPAASGASEDLEARMQLRLRVQNPNGAPIEYNGVYVELDVQNKGLASGVSSQSGTVPAFGEAVIGVPVELSYLGVAGEAMSLLSGKSLETVTYKMRGKLNSSTSGALPFESQGELNLADVMSGK
jgi:LEA14-like dessication related protein